MPDKPISNEEIDALMEAVLAGQVDSAGGSRHSKNIKIYDFARPEKFSKEQIRTLEMIHASCARGLTTQLSTLLRTAIEVELISTSDTSYLEFFESIANPASIALMSIDPLVGRAMLEIDPEMSFTLIDRILGGPGHPPKNVRELTEIEKGIMERVIVRAMKCITDAWSTLVPMKPQLEMIIGSTLFSQIALPDDRMMLARFSIKMGRIAGNLSFGIPITALDPILSKLNAQQWFSGGRQSSNEGFSGLIQDSLDNTDLDVTAVLGSAELTINDLLDLQVGDLICLDQRAGSDLSIVIGQGVKFRGQPGQIGRRLGLKITEVVEEES